MGLEDIRPLQEMYNSGQILSTGMWNKSQNMEIKQKCES